MNFTCPKCNSTNVSKLSTAQKKVASLGAIAGAMYGIRLGSAFGPLGILTGAITGLISGAIAGCEAGQALGKVIDERIINEYQCNNCHYKFSN